jgi:hypothetical protein
MKKFRIPRKKKKQLKKTSYALIIPGDISREFVHKVIKIMKQPYSAPFKDVGWDKFPLKENKQDYIWEIEKR